MYLIPIIETINFCPYLYRFKNVYIKMCYFLINIFYIT